MSQKQKQTTKIIHLVNQINHTWGLINQTDIDIANWYAEPIPCVTYIKGEPEPAWLLWQTAILKEAPVDPQENRPRYNPIYLGHTEVDMIKNLTRTLQDMEAVLSEHQNRNHG